MKKIQLAHDLAAMVLRGEKTSSWRLFDKDDVTVNDQVVIIDKVEPEQPQTWRVIGSGRVNRIIEKRMGDISEEDYVGHQRHASAEERLDYYRGVYGDRVNWDTPVKMIHFDFTPGVPAEMVASDDKNEVPEKQQLIGERVTLYADGGSRGNPGPSACGYVLIDEDDNVLVDKGMYLGITTNNQAEYQGLKMGLTEAKRLGAREVTVRLDSLLVVNQMKGVFKVKNRELWPIHESIKELLSDFRKVSFTHVPRELNKLADAAANRAMDEAMTGRGLD
jgi:ribonuclease HI